MKSMTSLQTANRLGIFFVLLLLVCFAWYGVNTTQRELHLALFQVSFYGFQSMSIVSMILAVIQVYVWAYIFVGLWALVSPRMKQ